MRSYTEFSTFFFLHCWSKALIVIEFSLIEFQSTLLGSRISDFIFYLEFRPPSFLTSFFIPFQVCFSYYKFRMYKKKFTFLCYVKPNFESFPMGLVMYNDYYQNRKPIIHLNKTNPIQFYCSSAHVHRTETERDR